LGGKPGAVTIIASRALPEPALDIPVQHRRPSDTVAFAALLLSSALLYLVNLGASGWANAFYAAAVQAASTNWQAWFFGSSDAANAITVDKTPGALWVMGLSARIFGFNPWSMLVPQALMGVASVAVLYLAVRRIAGPHAALLAGAVLAVTPAAALMFRFNNPDALLVLSLTVAAYCLTRALATESNRLWMTAVGLALGVGFLAKMLQAFLVAPVFALVFCVCAGLPLRQRLLRLLGGIVALVATAGAYLLTVTVWPVGSRPYIGGSQHNSIIELALGYNGLGRITGNETGGLGNMNFDRGWGRLLAGDMGGQIGWLLPAALIALIAGLILTRRAPRTDPTRAALLIWGGWLVVTAGVLSFMNGIVHPYYTVALAPAVAACIGIGIPILWRKKSDIRCATTLCGIIAITAALAFVLLQRHQDWLPWLRWLILLTGLTASLLVLVVSHWTPRATTALAVVAVVATLAAPAAFSIATAATPHRGAIPSAGPSGGFGGGPPGLLDATTPTAELTAMLTENATDYTWIAAAVGSNNAAGYQLSTGLPVMAVGGFNGTDPAPTLAAFQDDVAAGRIHYFIGGDMMMHFGFRGGSDSGGSDAAQQITEWVKANFPAHTVGAGRGAVTVYDLSA